MTAATARDIARLEAKVDRLLRLLGGREDRLLTLAEAAEYTGYSATHLRRLAVVRREIPYQQSGAGCKLRFRQSDLDAHGPNPAQRPTRRGRIGSQATANDIILGGLQ